eukprot:Polyplicarium_translucidae@DN3071_c0_g1_i1.p1
MGATDPAADASAIASTVSNSPPVNPGSTSPGTGPDRIPADEETSLAARLPSAGAESSGSSAPSSGGPDAAPAGLRDFMGSFAYEGHVRLRAKSEDDPFASRPASAPSPLAARTADVQRQSVRAVTVAFNQQATCFACATTAGFRIYTCEPLKEFRRRETGAASTENSPPPPRSCPTSDADDLSERGLLKGDATAPWGDGCCLTVRMLCRTNIMALVTANEPRKVKLWDDRKSRFIGELRSRQDVRGVCLERDVVALITVQKVYVYLAEQMAPFTILPTCPNPTAICVAWTCPTQNGMWRLACPAGVSGAVRVQLQTDGDPRASQLTFQAHESSLACLAFNEAGSMIATTSVLGTVIRIFSIVAKDVVLTHELRRGSQPTSLTSLAFRSDSEFLAAASTSNTLHIFKLSGPAPGAPGKTATGGPILRASTMPSCYTAAAADPGSAQMSRLPSQGQPSGVSRRVESLAHSVPGAAAAVKKIVRGAGAMAAAKAAIAGGKKSLYADRALHRRTPLPTPQGQFRFSSQWLSSS